MYWSNWYCWECIEKTSSKKKPLAIACTQQEKLFTEIAEETNHEIPHFFNIRETAGWSKNAKKSSAKISSLILDASKVASSNQTSRSLSFKSTGRCLIYGKSDAVLYVSEYLSEFLGISILASWPQILPKIVHKGFTWKIGDIKVEQIQSKLLISE